MNLLNKINTGTLKLEIAISKPEKFLNLLWSKDVRVLNITRINIATLRLEINYESYDEVKKLVKKSNGKMKIVGRKGFNFYFRQMKRQASIIVGIILFVIGLYALSTRVWSIEINTKENIAPFEIRKELQALGIKPGLSKNDIDVYTLEKKLININKDILWVRARIEGSTLKIIIEEKVSPPNLTESNQGEGDCVAKSDGQVKRVYVTSGTSNVQVGDYVKEGDVLIRGQQGKEGQEFAVKAKGTVIADTFYEKEMEVKVSGTEKKRTGNKDKDIYIEVFHKKIYLKKATNKFIEYDKIEENKGVLHEVTYFEKADKDVEVNKDEASSYAADQLEQSLSKELSNDAKIKSKEIYVENIEDGKIRVKVMFAVEENLILTEN